MKLDIIVPQLLLLLHYVVADHLELPLTKRSVKQGTKDVDLVFSESFFAINTTVGNPPQLMELLIDTGSSDTWVMSSENPYCVDSNTWKSIKGKNDTLTTGEEHAKQAPMGASSLPCFIHGTFNPKGQLRESYNESTDPFDVKYADKTMVEGVWADADFKVGNLYNLTHFEFGIGKKSNTSQGILGLGIPDFSVKDGEIHYHRLSFPMKLNKAGLIQRQLFSMWLGEGNLDGGKVLFGGIDHAKYIPPLYTMKMINSRRPGYPIERLQVMLTDVTMRKQSDDVGFSLFNESAFFKGKYSAALVDSGSTANYLPREMYNKLIGYLNAIELKQQQRHIVKCSDFDDDNKTMTFKFASKSFNIPFKNFLTPLKPHVRLYHQDDITNSEEYCILAFVPQEPERNYTLLGQPFMRSIYTVFDMDSMEISMAPAVYTDKSEIRDLQIGEQFPREMDGDVPEELKLDFYNPKSDFIQDITNGYYKSISGATSGINNRYLITRMVISITLTFALMCLL